MCGTFGVAPTAGDKLIERYNISKQPKNMGSLLRYKKLPTDLIATICEHEIVPRKWWFVPAWATNPVDLKFPAFNARAETVGEKSVYRDAWAKGQRCIIPASFFVEWKQVLGADKKIFKQPCLIKPKNDEFFSLAGIYETWTGRNGEKIDTCSIITTEPNTLVKKVHDRMPVIIDRKDEDVWLNKGSGVDEVENLMVPREERFMEMFEIDREYAKKKSEEMNESSVSPL